MEAVRDGKATADEFEQSHTTDSVRNAQIYLSLGKLSSTLTRSYLIIVQLNISFSKGICSGVHEQESVTNSSKMLPVNRK